MTTRLEKALHELRSTLGKMEVALGYTDNAVVWTDTSGAVQWCNSVFDRLVGLPHINALGRDLIRMLPLEESGRILPREAHPVQTILSDKSELRGYYHFSQENSRLFLEIIGQYFEFGASGGSAVLTIRDVTDMREFEQIKLQSLALDAAAQAIVITDRDGRVTWANQAFSNLTGYTFEEVYLGTLKILRSGKTDSSVFQEMWQTVISGRVWSGTIVNRKKNGELYSEEQTITPVYGTDGRISNFIAIKQDVTEKKRITDELFMSEARMRAVLETAADGIVTINERGIIESANPAAERIFGYSNNELIGRNVKVLMPEPYRGHHDGYLENYLKTGRAKVIGFGREALGRRSDGTVFPLELSLSEIKMGRQRWFTGIMRDITARKRAESEIIEARRESEKANRSKSVFLSNMSHEIRTPLNAIIGVAGILRETELEAEQQKLIEVIVSAGDNLQTLINDILDLSKIEAGQVTLEYRNFCLKEIISQTCEGFKFSAREKDIYFDFRIAADVPTALAGDPFRLRQILTNLLGNAFKFTDKGRIVMKVTVSPPAFPPEKTMAADAHTAGLLFSIEDTGIGIPQDRIDDIFGRFSQADDSITSNYGGTGLGLAISRQLVEMMGGRIWVESRLGQGSTFYFSATFQRWRPDSEVDPAPGADSLGESLPEPETLDKQKIVFPKELIDRDTMEETMLAEERPGESEDEKTYTILLAEDNQDNKRIVRLFFKKTAIGVDVAENGQAAFEKFKEKRYDLVLMDVRMPVMDGYQATEKIRQWEKANNIKETPVIALTAHALKEDAQKSVRAGCNNHLTKPIRKDHLLNTVWKYLQKPKAAHRRIEYTGRPKAVREDKGIVVRVDSDLEDLIPGFLKNRANDIREMRRHWAGDDFEPIGNIGHGLKGAGGTYGFDAITRFGREIEKAAEGKDKEVIGRLIDELADYLDKIEILFE